MPSQKEIIHLTFGTLANHISTSFFNQQSSHFQYPEQERTREGEDKNPLLFDPNIDFQEGIGTRRSESTFFPRQVLFDFKSNIGTAWDAYSVIVDDALEDEGDDDEDGEEDESYGHSVLKPSKAANEGLHAWDRPAEVQWVGGLDGKMKSTRFGQSMDIDEDDYEEESSEEEESEIGRRNEDQHQQGISHKRNVIRKNAITSASYAHNSLHPRSIRSLPNLFGGGSLVPMGTPAQEGRTPFSTFEMGMGLSRHLDKEESILDEQIRWFAEDSDSLQSFSLTTSTFDGFSGMAHEMMQIISDEFPKTSVLAWGADYEIDTTALSEAQKLQSAHYRRTNNALALWSLSSASLYIPMALPEQLTKNRSKSPSTEYFSSRAIWSDMSYIGGLFASHIDTATLTSRLHDEHLRRPIATVVSSLNWRRNTPIAQMGGCIPTPLLAPVKDASRPLDPIEALLASRGYDPRRQEKRDASRMTDEDRAKIAASAIRKGYLDLSQRPSKESADSNKEQNKPYAQHMIARDDDRLAELPTRAALQAFTALDEPTGYTDFVPAAFNIRGASFPQMFRKLTSNGRPLPPTQTESKSDEGESGQRMRKKVSKVPMLASLSTTPSTAHLLADARRFVDSTLIKGHQPLMAFGIGGSRGRSGAGQAANEETEGFLGGRDGLMEVRERLEELLGAYEEGLSNGRIRSTEEQDAVGTDEECAQDDDDDEEDWDL